MRIVLHTIHALNCGFSSVLVNTSDFDVIVILIRHLSSMIESDPCLHGWNIEDDYLIPQWITIPDVAAMCT